MINIRLEDSLEYLSHIPDELFDLALIDPPYFDYKTQHRKDKKDKLSQSLVQQPREDQLRTIHECIRTLKVGCAFYVYTNWQNIWWMQERFETFLRNMIIWDKGNWTAGDLEGSFGNKYEVILLGVKGKGWKYRGPRMHDIWEIPRVGSKRSHSTEKPVKLYTECIERATDPGALVFDPYVGSGSSAEACLRTGRYFVGCEVDPEYHSRATKRIEEVESETNRLH